MKTTTFIFIIVFFAVINISASDKMAVLDYDYTSPAVKQGGIYQPPQIIGEAEILADKDASIKLDGKKNYLKVTGGEKITLKNGGSLFVVVSFLDSDTNIKTKTGSSLDMIFFKKNDFLLGRYGKFLYFNIASNNKWEAPVYSLLPLKNSNKMKWLCLAVSVSLKNGNYKICTYVNGKKVKVKTFKNYQYTGSSEPLTIGKGWGGPWMLHGKIAQVKIYDFPLSETEMFALYEKSPYKER
jgi:hypothetical protein